MPEAGEEAPDDLDHLSVFVFYWCILPAHDEMPHRANISVIVAIPVCVIYFVRRGADFDYLRMLLSSCASSSWPFISLAWFLFI